MKAAGAWIPDPAALAHGLLRRSGKRARIAIEVTDISQGAGEGTSIASGLEQELRHQLARTTHLDPITAEHPSDVRDIVSPEDGQLQVRSLLQSLAGDGSYPYVGSFELPMGPRSEVERQAAKRIAAELRRALRATGMSAASATPALFGVNREAGSTLRACKAPGLGPTSSQ